MLFETWVTRRSANSDLGCTQKSLETAVVVGACVRVKRHIWSYHPGM